MAGVTEELLGPFLGRLVRLDPGALVRMRPAVPGRLTVWGRVPWGILVARTVPASSAEDVPASFAEDVTVSAREFLDRLIAGGTGLPERRDAQWRWSLPGSWGEPIESVPAEVLLRLGAAAADTLRSSAGRVGERKLRDALLDHVAVEVRTGDTRVEVRQGLVQALLRMGLVTDSGQGPVTVRTLSGWVGLEADAGYVWAQRRTDLSISIIR